MIIGHTGIKTCSGEDADLVIPPHPELDEYPAWLKERALEREPELMGTGEDSGAAAVDRIIREIGECDWLDHYGTAVWVGKEFLISEPYGMNREMIDQLLHFCDALNLVFKIQASGHHCPTKTMRILVWPKEWDVLDEQSFYEDSYDLRPEFLEQSKWARECQARHTEISRRASSDMLTAPAGGADDDGQSGFAQEEDLRDYLAGNLQLLEDGMTLWPVGKEQSAGEFAVDGGRIDILARSSRGSPTVIELKVSRGYGKTISQVLLYRARVKELFNSERVPIVIVAREISRALKAAAGEVPDVSLFQYRLSMTLTRA